MVWSAELHPHTGQFGFGGEGSETNHVAMRSGCKRGPVTQNERRAEASLPFTGEKVDN